MFLPIFFSDLLPHPSPLSVFLLSGSPSLLSSPPSALSFLLFLLPPVFYLFPSYAPLYTLPLPGSTRSSPSPSCTIFAFSTPISLILFFFLSPSILSFISSFSSLPSSPPHLLLFPPLSPTPTFTSYSYLLTPVCTPLPPALPLHTLHHLFSTLLPCLLLPPFPSLVLCSYTLPSFFTPRPRFLCLPPFCFSHPSPSFLLFVSFPPY